MAAPVFNKIAIAPPAPDPAQQPPVDRKVVIAAMRFGEALEELVARCRLQPDTPDAPRVLDSRFPQDLSHRRSPKALLLGTLQKLLTLEQTVILEFRRTETGTTDQALPSGDPGNRRQTETGPPSPEPRPGGPGTPASRPDGLGSQQTEANATVAELPSLKIKIEQKISELLGAYEGNASPENLYRYLSGPDGIDEAIRRWDDSIVDIVDNLAILSSYKVGKALSLTRWQIWASKHPTSAEGVSPSEPWKEAWDKAFREQRIGEIQRHLNLLSTVLDSQAVTVVSTGLGY